MLGHRERSYAALKRATITDRGKGKVNYIADLKMSPYFVIMDFQVQNLR